MCSEIIDRAFKQDFVDVDSFLYAAQKHDFSSFMIFKFVSTKLNKCFENGNVIRKLDGISSLTNAFLYYLNACQGPISRSTKFANVIYYFGY